MAVRWCSFNSISRKFVLGLLSLSLILGYFIVEFSRDSPFRFAITNFRPIPYNVTGKYNQIWRGTTIESTKLLQSSDRDTSHSVHKAADKPVSIKNVTLYGYTIYYETCSHIPEHPIGTPWPEETYIHDPPLTSLTNLVKPANCIVRLVGPEVVKLQDTITLHIELYDGNGNKRKGGDLVRVWMREESLGAGSVAKVTDNWDGSYEAEVVAFWVGRPQIRVAVISLREVIALQFKRRYICPPVLMNLGDFGPPDGRVEQTPCSVYPQVPGFKKICNLTHENQGRPWYCGEPRSHKCADWSMSSDKPLWDRGYDHQLYNTLEKQILSRSYQGLIIPTNFTVEVKSDDNQLTVPAPGTKCNIPDRRHTWVQTPPTGYLYNKQWTTRTCSGRDRSQDLSTCVKNTKFILIGDSTVRQMFSSLVDMVPCEWGTDKITKANKHSQFNCENPDLNYYFEYSNHELPFCTTKNKREFLKSVKSSLMKHHEKDESHSNVVILIHVYTHFLNYHSHLFYDFLKYLKRAIIDLLDANPDAKVIIKGAHSFTFQLTPASRFLHKPERYMDTYIKYLMREFRDVQDRVIYLDAADITIATEQTSLHPEEYIVRELIFKMLDFVCSY